MRTCTFKYIYMYTHTCTCTEYVENIYYVLEKQINTFVHVQHVTNWHLIVTNPPPHSHPQPSPFFLRWLCTPDNAF